MAKRLTPTHILRTGSGSGSRPGLSMLSRRRATVDPLASALAQEPAPNPENSDSVLDSLKGGLTDAVQTAGRTLSYAPSAVIAGAVELGDALRPLRGAESTASFSDFRENINRRIGVGDVLTENTLTDDLPLNARRALGLIGDIAVDPLNLVGLGTTTAARSGLSKVAAAGGDDVSRAFAQGGEEAADALLRQRAADAAQEAAEAAAARPRSKKLATAAQDAAVAAEQPLTVRSILGGAGLNDDAIERSIAAVGRTGQGGVRFAGKTLVSGERIAATAGAQVGRAGLEALRASDLGTTFRRALIPATKTRDAFGKQVAGALAGIGRRRAQMISFANADLQRLLKPIVKKVGTDERRTILAALDVGGNVANARDMLVQDGLNDAVKLLDTLVLARDRGYDQMVQAGYRPGIDLMAKDDYIRHSLTDEGLAALGIDPKTVGRRAGTRGGKIPERVREGGILQQNENFGITAYSDDPVDLVRSSYALAYEVGGNKMAWDALDDLAKQTGQKITSKSAKTGFVRVAPNRYVAQEIYDDLFNLGRAMTDNSLVRAWDTFSAAVKRQTLFNPIAFGPYFTQNMATGIGINAAGFGVRAADYPAWMRLRSAVKQAQNAGLDDFDDTLRRLLPDPDDYQIAKDAWDEGIIDAGHNVFDDIASGNVEFGKGITNKAKWLSQVGTKNTVALNSFGEEMLRGTAYMRSRLDGLLSDEAAALVQQRHIDYSALGRTAFERNAINRFIFFPSWLLRAPSAIVRTYANAPGTALAQLKAEQGTRWYDREQNQYGEVIGPRLSGPMSFLTGLGNEVPNAGTELMNPLARFVLDEEARGLTDVLPPLSNVLGEGDRASRLERVTGLRGSGGGESSPENQTRYLASLLGVRSGVDYSNERSLTQLEDDVAARAAEGLGPTASQLLKITAEESGINGAAGMNTGDLVFTMVERGWTLDDIRRILDVPRDAPTPRPVLPSVDDLFGAGANRQDLYRVLSGG